LCSTRYPTYEAVHSRYWRFEMPTCGVFTGCRREEGKLAGWPTAPEYLDILIDEFQLHVELDGRLGHDRARELWRDMKRDNRSEELRLRGLRYGWADLADRPCDAAIQQAIILRQQGWTGPFIRCAACPDRLPAGL
jgi:hypothetical protein